MALNADLSPSPFLRKDSVKCRSRTRSHQTLSEEMEDNFFPKFDPFDEKVSIISQQFYLNVALSYTQFFFQNTNKQKNSSVSKTFIWKKDQV